MEWIVALAGTLLAAAFVGVCSAAYRDRVVLLRIAEGPVIYMLSIGEACCGLALGAFFGGLLPDYANTFAAWAGGIAALCLAFCATIFAIYWLKSEGDGE